MQWGNGDILCWGVGGGPDVAMGDGATGGEVPLQLVLTDLHDEEGNPWAGQPFDGLCENSRPKGMHMDT